MLGYSDRRPLTNQAAGTTLDAGAVGDLISLPIPLGRWKVEDAWVVLYGAELSSVCAIEFAHRPVAGTDVSRSAACGSAALVLVKPTGSQTGKMLYKRAAADYFVQGGGEIMISISVSATSTTVLYFGGGVTLRESPEDPANMTRAYGGTATVAGTTGGIVASA